MTGHTSTLGRPAAARIGSFPHLRFTESAAAAAERAVAVNIAIMRAFVQLRAAVSYAAFERRLDDLEGLPFPGLTWRPPKA